MVKDEIDIVEVWLKYHGTIFGYQNLYVVDNMSDDGTFEKLQEYQSKGVFLIQKDDYNDIIMNELTNEEKEMLQIIGEDWFEDLKL